MVNKETRRLWAEKTFELTNIGAGVLFFGQFLSKEGFQILPAIAGLILILAGYFASYSLLKRR